MKSISEGMSRFWRRLNKWVASHKKISVSLVILLVAAGASLLAAAILYQPAVQAIIAQQKAERAKKAEVFLSPLTGKKVANQAATKRQVTGIMLENSLDARPQSGLKAAGVVYEAVAEGGITRFLALYQEARPGLIGPVRSLRPYYVNWLTPYDAAVAHVGGSRKALELVRSKHFKDIDQFFNDSAYWRATDRAAPHNVYTNFNRLDALNKSKGFTNSTFTGFPRKLDSPAVKPTAKRVNVSISGPIFDSSYTYNKKTNSYLRSEGGIAHNDREAGQLSPKTVVVIKIPVKLGLEDGYREQMETSGHNKAYIFQDGIVTEGYWYKKNRFAQIKFHDKAGRPIAFNVGQTWITAIAPDKSVTWR